MALIKFSAAVGAASGKSGGIVFSRNKGGAYIRAFAVPTNPNTAKQQSVRTQLANLVSSWRNLTAAQQQAWTDMAPQYPYINRLGDVATYTGQQLYIKLNQNLNQVGATLLTVPRVPQTFTTTQVSSLTMTLTAGVLTTADVVLTAAGVATESLIITTTVGQSGGVTKPAKGAFKITDTVDDASAGTTFGFITEYQALYGDPELGAKIFCRVDMINENTGQRINLGQAVATVGGT